MISKDKTNGLKWLLVLVLLIGSTGLLMAQSIVATVSSNTIALGDKVTVTYDLKGDISPSQLLAPRFKNFDVIGGPNQTSKLTIVNGRTNKVVRVSYILYPQKEGIFFIAPATANVKGKKIQSKKLQVKVVKGSGTTTQRPPNRANPRAAQPQQNVPKINDRKDNVKDKLIFRVVTDSIDAYEGQQVTVRYRLYTTVDITDFDIRTPPSLTGFWVQDITPSRINVAANVYIDSVLYRAYDLKTYAVFPQRSGKVEIDPMTVQVVAQMPNYNRPPTFWGRRTSPQQKLLTTDPVSLNVKPLPSEGKPNNFAGVVGQYKLGYMASSPKAAVNESVKISYTITGKGNIKLIDMPRIDFGPDFEVFDPVVTEDVYPQSNEIRGRKKYEYTLIPKRTGNLEIPAVNFHYFDPERGRYRSAHTNQSRISVVAGEGGITSTAEVSEDEHLELHPLKYSNQLAQKGGSFFNTVFFWGGMLLPLCFLPFLVIRHRRREAELADVVSYRRKMATQVAIQKLKTAEGHMQRNEKKPFYDEVIKSIWGYLHDKTGIKTSELSKTNIQSVLEEKGASTEKVNKLIQIIEYCEMALFAPVADADNLRGTYDDTIQLITEIEEEINEQVPA